jgi:uncharacterized protein
MSTSRRIVASHPEAIFIAGAFIVQALIVLSQHLHIHNHGLSGMRLFMPAIWAIGVTFALAGGAGVRKLLGSLAVWRVAPKFYAFALLYPSAVALFALGALRLTGQVETIHFDFGEAAGFDFLWLSVRISLVEEIAWVGFLLERLSRRWRLFGACMAAGAAWGVWYIPLVLAEIQVAPGLPIFPLILNFMTIAAICGWLYLRTKSAFVVFVMQLTTNYTSQIIPVLPLRGGVRQYIAFVVMKALLALALYWFWGPRPLFGGVPKGRSSLELQHASPLPS